MIARTIRLLLACTLPLIGVAAHAQNNQSTRNTQPSPNTAEITLGQSAVPLYGPWKFTVGDSPIDPKTGQPLWAEPDFDDSKWETVDLTPKDGAFDPTAGLSGYVPGWTAKGHPGYWGYAWYRIRVRVHAQPGRALALSGPKNVDDAYQVFENGKLAGHFGDFNGNKVVIYATQPRMFALAPAGKSDAGIGAEIGAGNGPGGESARVVAFRLWMEPNTLTQQSQAEEVGGLHTAPVLGDEAAVAADYQRGSLELIRAYASDGVLALIFGLLAVLAFSLILFDRSDPVYLWMGFLFLLLFADSALTFGGEMSEIVPFVTGEVLSLCTHVMIYEAWVMVWWVWFGLRKPAWLPRVAAGLALPMLASFLLSEELFVGLIPHTMAPHFYTLSLVLRLIFHGLTFWVVLKGIRRQGVEGWLVLPAVIMRAIASLPLQSWIHVRSTWLPFGVRVSIVHVANVLMTAVIALLLLRRLLQSVQSQRMMALDVKQAQQVQQVILPEARLALPGLTIESEYRPAREVGGDFFQIIPNATDGSVLIVAGDVAGKGLQAGMLVALLVGAIRTAAHFASEPKAILAELNQRLLGRGDAQATCLAMRIAADGSVTLANAGHIAPYLNGEELAMEGALPLGIFGSAEPSVMHFQLEPSDRLTLMSDGIAEATDANGKLFGFERVHELLRTARSAAGIANAAQAFGQDDDISVISVTRAPALEPAMA